ncbi:hypothetical protein DFP72DRAFT_1043825 [Ephemerocybe angulata]|uniref:Uncharacterized protein n=1 Tax=Ephemerocybe angulata TaxID=980116 RepID=A0A8H6I5I3_9AGAR|nr:hypothetical protein DFP72DRAFT_1043825 [Tulosesus angulatus]
MKLPSIFSFESKPCGAVSVLEEDHPGNKVRARSVSYHQGIFSGTTFNYTSGDALASGCQSAPVRAEMAQANGKASRIDVEREHRNPAINYHPIRIGLASMFQVPAQQQHMWSCIRVLARKFIPQWIVNVMSNDGHRENTKTSPIERGRLALTVTAERSLYNRTCRYNCGRIDGARVELLNFNHHVVSTIAVLMQGHTQTPRVLARGYLCYICAAIPFQEVVNIGISQKGAGTDAWEHLSAHLCLAVHPVHICPARDAKRKLRGSSQFYLPKKDRRTTQVGKGHNSTTRAPQTPLSFSDMYIPQVKVPSLKSGGIGISYIWESAGLNDRTLGALAVRLCDEHNFSRFLGHKGALWAQTQGSGATHVRGMIWECRSFRADGKPSELGQFSDAKSKGGGLIVLEEDGPGSQTRARTVRYHQGLLTGTTFSYDSGDALALGQSTPLRADMAQADSTASNNILEGVALETVRYHPIRLGLCSDRAHPYRTRLSLVEYPSLTGGARALTYGNGPRTDLMASGPHELPPPSRRLHHAAPTQPRRQLLEDSLAPRSAHENEKESRAIFLGRQPTNHAFYQLGYGSRDAAWHQPSDSVMAYPPFPRGSVPFPKYLSAASNGPLDYPAQLLGRIKPSTLIGSTGTNCSKWSIDARCWDDPLPFYERPFVQRDLSSSIWNSIHGGTDVVRVLTRHDSTAPLSESLMGPRILPNYDRDGLTGFFPSGVWDQSAGQNLRGKYFAFSRTSERVNANCNSASGEN